MTLKQATLVGDDCGGPVADGGYSTKFRQNGVLVATLTARVTPHVPVDTIHFVPPIPIVSSGSPAFIIEGGTVSLDDDVASCGHTVVASARHYITPKEYPPFPPEVELVAPQANFPRMSAKQAVIASAEDSQPMNSQQRAAAKAVGLDPDAKPNNTPQAESSSAPAPPSPPPTSCSGIPHAPPVNYSFSLSPNFTVAKLSNAAKVSSYNVVASGGLTEDQILCNLMNLAVNILEPLNTQFPGLFVTSGFRTPASTSWHTKGSAADIQWSGASDADYYDRAVWIKNNLSFCELILEYGANRPWIHCAWNAGSGNPGTKFGTRVRAPATYQWGKLLKLNNKPGYGGV